MTQLAVVFRAFFGPLQRTYTHEGAAGARPVTAADARRIGRPGLLTPDQIGYPAQLTERAGHSISAIVAKPANACTSRYRHLPRRLPDPLTDQAASHRAARQTMSVTDDPPPAGKKFEVGDRVVLRRPIRGLLRARVPSGATGIVVALAPAGDSIEVRFDTGDTELLSPAQIAPA